jgi:hypothetical protein
VQPLNVVVKFRDGVVVSRWYLALPWPNIIYIRLVMHGIMNVKLFPSVPCNMSGAVREILVKKLQIPLHRIELIHNFRGGSSCIYMQYGVLKLCDNKP